MANTISGIAQQDPYKLQQHNNKNLERIAEKHKNNLNKPTKESDPVTISNQAEEISSTYSSSLTVETENIEEQYNLLRGLVINMLKEQGIDFKVANGEQEIDISSISQEEATALIAEDGYFGVEQTSDRIVEFAIGVAGDDPARLEAIIEGVEQGFNEALEAFGGWLPDISYDTYDAVMNKLDAWADTGNQNQDQES